MLPPFHRRLTAIPSFQKRLDPTTRDGLGAYVYALIDERNKQPFYIGKGLNERPNGHLHETIDAERGKRPHNPKTKRIVSIWRQRRSVNIIFLRINLQPDAVDDVEGALIDGLNLYLKPPLTNKQSAKGKRDRGMLTLDGAIERLAPLPQPQAHNVVIFLNIKNSLQAEEDLYEATRGDWQFGESIRAQQGAIALGMKDGVSQAAFLIERWEPAGQKWAFVGQPIDADDLVKKNWKLLLREHDAWRQNGGRLACQFDGKGSYKVLFGEKNASWHPLPQHNDK